MSEPGKRAKKTILTLGYGRQNFVDIAEKLRTSGVQIVVDVRSSPHSKQSPEFNQKCLAERLPKLGITYHHLKELGGKGREENPRSPNTGLSKAWRAYADYMQSEDFERGLVRLLALAAIGPVALLCAEADYAKCHRRFLADALTVRGLKVAHLNGDGQVLEHQLNPRLEVRKGKLLYPGAGEQLALF